MKELRRVMSLGARAVLLTSDTRAIQRGLERTSGLYLDQQHTVIILGRKSHLFVIQKR
jgi:hypothetical protein